MNEDIFKGKWKQVRGDVKRWWGKLTDDDVRYIDGNKDKMIGKLQERYGFSREEAQRNLDKRLDEIGKVTK